MGQLFADLGFLIGLRLRLRGDRHNVSVKIFVSAFAETVARSQIKGALVRHQLMGGKVYYRHAERHKANDAIAALLDADLRSPNIPESRSVHHDALGDEFRGVKPRLVERSGFQILQVILNPSIHFRRRWAFCNRRRCARRRVPSIGRPKKAKTRRTRMMETTSRPAGSAIPGWLSPPQ